MEVEKQGDPTVQEWIGRWADDNPYYLLINTSDRGFVEIDLGEHGWLTKYAEWFRLVANWHLVEKVTGMIKLILAVHEGEQPYYVARHVGMASSFASREMIAYGIGKKRKIDDQWVTERLWMMPDGTVCGGDDVDFLGIEYLKRQGPL